MTPNIITITAESQGSRLDKFLVENLTEISRSQIQKIIKAGDVLVNGKKASVHCFLKVGDSVVIPTEVTRFKKAGNEAEESLRPLTKGSLDSVRPGRTPLGMTREIKIIADEPDFLIIEKPAGLLVHPTAQEETNTLVDWLLDKYPELKKIGDSPERPAIVHRLDKEVSGVMIVPKTQAAFDSFKKQFQEHTIIKKYAALVYGEINKDEVEINFPISRSKTKEGHFAAHPQSQDLIGKKAVTRFNIIKRFKNYTLLEVQILTGRTHQIRVHLLAYGYPVVGDKLYINRKIKPAKLDRIFLHAKYLSFVDLQGEKREFESELPKELSSFLKTL